uniref:Calponin-homology (CH) domain-containing protein n=1 Tax=Coccidioides posadasii RMSCC 3488 TaxID=454284 RepID=A0A0J6FNB1_COCPO|nr:hypothetical protein CPAG_06721 [Coccidioides posadasii RMSCC 3488]
MPAFRYSEAATPCPANWKRSRPSFDIYDDNDNTVPLEFTTDLRSVSTSIQQQPRRVKRAATFKIHEDGPGGKASGLPTAAWRKTTVGRGGSSMLSQPAQRLPTKQKVRFAVSQSPRGDQKKTGGERQSLVPKQQASSQVKKPISHDGQDKEVGKIDPLKRDRRRQTIYIPPEDTTMPTMFMSIFSPLKVDIGQEDEVDAFEARIAKRRNRKNSPPREPQRAPLQQPLRVAQESAIKQDIAGSNTGKENLPPGLSPCAESGKKKDFDVFDLSDFKPLSVEKFGKKSLSNVTAGNLDPPPQKKAIERDNRVLRPSCPNSPRTQISTGKATKLRDKPFEEVPKKRNGKHMSGMGSVRKASTDPGKISRKSSSKQQVKERPPVKIAVPRILSLDIAQKYPIISEDISNPYMYEENWLAHQEIVLTQLANALFDSGHCAAIAQDAQSLRHELLEHYQDAHFSLLYKRVQASLLYGALRIPKDILSRGNRLREDIGMRRKFLNLWLSTYDLSALRAAAETVIGRRISIPVDSPAQPKASSQKILRRSMEEFLDTFLIKNEDSNPIARSVKSKENDVEGSPFCKTLLRSIMIILLLDKARIAPGTYLPQCLFVTSSEYKSSAALLRALGSLLLPTVGDIGRALSHLDFQVSYEQCRLQEHHYRIKNLAVDLRDGILLTRLAELLLFQLASDWSQQQKSENTTTVTMPTGQVLSLLPSGNEWPLSQHLKIPCVSRASKIFNVQIALSALSGIRGVGVIVKDIRPEDIVDGYREKTIALLWGLVGKWGLHGLLDWEDLKREISRLKTKLSQMQHDNHATREEEQAEFDNEHERETFLLRRWASCLAGLKGLRLDNMTTSFADGKIFESIVDEYEVLINHESTMAEDMVEGQEGQKSSLAQRLHRLGCSAQFASLVAPSDFSPMHVFDKDFTLGALAFLCSRFLSASKRVRATLVIQSAWRSVLSKRKN